MSYNTFLCFCSDLKVFYSKLLDIENCLLSFLLPVKVLLFKSFNPPWAQVVVLQGNLMRHFRRQSCKVRNIYIEIKNTLLLGEFLPNSSLQNLVQ